MMHDPQYVAPSCGVSSNVTPDPDHSVGAVLLCQDVRLLPHVARKTRHCTHGDITAARAQAAGMLHMQAGWPDIVRLSSSILLDTGHALLLMQGS